MSLRKETPCDFGECPYDAVYHTTCDWYCSEEEPEEDYEEWYEDGSDWERDLERTQEWERTCAKEMEKLLYEYEEDYEEWDEDDSDLERYEYEEDIECGFNPYMGCYDFDC